ncbi:hypothetical protein D3C73_1103880 [compost metagenome]
MQMRRRSLGVAGIADVTQHIAWRHQLPAFNVSVAVQMRVVVPLAAGAQHPYHLAAKVVRAHLHHHAFGGGQHGRATGCKDVDAFVAPAARPRGAPGVGEPRGGNALHGYGQ